MTGETDNHSNVRRTAGAGARCGGVPSAAAARGGGLGPNDSSPLHRPPPSSLACLTQRCVGLNGWGCMMWCWGPWWCRSTDGARRSSNELASELSAGGHGALSARGARAAGMSCAGRHAARSARVSAPANVWEEGCTQGKHGHVRSLAAVATGRAVIQGWGGLRADTLESVGQPAMRGRCVPRATQIEAGPQGRSRLRACRTGRQTHVQERPWDCRTRPQPCSPIVFA